MCEAQNCGLTYTSDLWIWLPLPDWTGRSVGLNRKLVEQADTVGRRKLWSYPLCRQWCRLHSYNSCVLTWEPMVLTPFIFHCESRWCSWRSNVMTYLKILKSSAKFPFHSLNLVCKREFLSSFYDNFKDLAVKWYLKSMLFFSGNGFCPLIHTWLSSAT